MKNISEASNSELVEFFLRDDSYCNIPLPAYISFSKMLKNIHSIISVKSSPFYSKVVKPKDAKVSNINHAIICNKNNGLSWRKVTLINPYFYVHCVIVLTSDKVWPEIKLKLDSYLSNKKIKPVNIPFLKDKSSGSGVSQIIRNWWSHFENESMGLSVEYGFVANTDISNCYDSIYSHSLEWVFGSKEESKKGQGGLVGAEIDKLIQLMNEGQTNGILTGSEICNLFAELVLGDVDLKLVEKMTSLGVENYKILRYRDDYRIFSNTEVECMLILKELSEILQQYGLSLNANKTFVSNDIVASSVKKDKIKTITSPLPKDISIQKKLFFIYELSKETNHSKIINKYLNEIIFEVKRNGIDYNFNSINAICGIIINLVVLNSSVYQSAIALLSYVLNGASKEFRVEIIPLLHAKISKLPNTYYFNIWFQRLVLPFQSELGNDLKDHIFKSNDMLCDLINKRVVHGIYDAPIGIWDHSFVTKLGVSGKKLNELLDVMKEDNIIVYKEVVELSHVFEEYEFNVFASQESD